MEQVNNNPCFLGKVTRVVLFGRMLRPEVERLSDVDLAVEVASKEADFDRARLRNYERVEGLALRGSLQAGSEPACASDSGAVRFAPERRRRAEATRWLRWPYQ